MHPQRKEPPDGSSLRGHRHFDKAKQRRVEPKRPIYLSRAKLSELNHDQLVGEIFMRMIPGQFETRCAHNSVHFVLAEQYRDPLWRNTLVLSLLGKGQAFIPKPKPLSTMEVQGACARLEFRLMRASERYVELRWRVNIRHEGIRRSKLRGFRNGPRNGLHYQCKTAALTSYQFLQIITFFFKKDDTASAHQNFQHI